MWKDKLTSYDGTALTYDEIGNPYDYTHDRYFVWSGREMRACYTEEGDYVAYVYNENGLRSLKKIYCTDNIHYDGYYYFWSDDNRLLAYTVDYANTEDGYQVTVIYNSAKEPIGFTIGEDTYYYLKNIQGDVLCVTDKTGAPIVNYTYDAWGAMTITPASQNVSSQEVARVAFLNPVTYRGYFYDYELGLYYLQSRYYDPEMGRFISIDHICDTKIGITGTNMYAYCCNNPIILIDNNGKEAKLTATQVVAHLIGILAALAAIDEYLLLSQDQKMDFLAYFSNLDVGIGELYSLLIKYINFMITEKNNGRERVKEVVQAGLEGATEATAALAVTSVAQYMAIIPQTEALTFPIMIITAAGGFIAGALIEVANP